MKKIWGHTIVKNEDRYLWFAIKSVIEYLDRLIIYDTGSTDKTLEIIKLLQTQYPQKIHFEQKDEVDPSGLTKLRQEMLEKTKSDWFILIDGDEVWWEKSIKDVIDAIESSQNDLYAIVNPVVNLVGDIYHYQEEEAGGYEILGKKGHFNIRAINAKIPGLHLENNYPLEGYIDSEGKLIQSRDEKLKFINAPILHFSLLNRSSKSDSKTLHRDKVKVELGKSMEGIYEYPEVFNIERPKVVKNPFKEMDLKYKIKAALLTPLKKLKRRL